MKSKIEFINKKRPTILPKPANGTPFVNQIIERDTRINRESSDITNPEKVIKRKGLSEWANIPLKAKSKTLKVWAFDTPPNRGGRSIGIPMDLNPDHAKRPRTNRFLSFIFLTAW